MGITFEGESLEARLRRVDKNLSNEGVTRNDPRGDLFSTSSRMWEVFIEAKKNAWNQVRIWKYLVHVGWVEGDYYVVPPHVLVQKAIDRKGQHTYNPFECVGMGKPSPTNWFGEYRVKEKNLSQAIVDAYQAAHSQENIKYRDFAMKARSMAEALTEDLKQEGSLL